MGFINEKQGIKDRTLWQTIDHERNLILKNPYRDAKSKIEGFELQIAGRTVRFLTRLKKEFTDKRSIFSYHVMAIHVTEVLKNQEEEIRQYITEALDAFGCQYRKSRITTVKVTFSNSKSLFSGALTEKEKAFEQAEMDSFLGNSKT